MAKGGMIAWLMFFVALIGGVAVGLGISRALPRRPAGPPPFGRELDLTPEQSEKMRRIWEETVRAKMPEFHRRREELREEREAAVRALLDPEQLKQYERIQEEYHRKRRLVDEARQEVFEEAVAQTRGLLDEGQREKYDQIMTRMKERWHRRGPRPHGKHGKPAPRPQGKDGPPGRYAE